MAISPARPRITTAAQHIHAANTGQEGAKLEPPTCHVFRKLLQDIQLRYIESPDRPTYRFLRGKPEKQEAAKQDIAELKEKAQAGEIVLLSQDEARMPMVPTLQATLGVKGHRPKVGTWDCKDLLYLFCVVNLLSGALHSNTLESPKDAKKKTGKSKTRRLQEMFAQHLRHVGRVYAKEKHPEVGLLIDNAPWHA